MYGLGLGSWLGLRIWLALELCLERRRVLAFVSVALIFLVLKREFYRKKLYCIIK